MEPGSEKWILGDWGSTRLRLFLSTDDETLDAREGPGIGALSATPMDVLLRTIEPWREETDRQRIVLCGMAGSRNGIAEAPYARLPADRMTWLKGTLSIKSSEADIHLAAGLCGANRSGVMDVMRGEETQIFGAIDQEPALARGRQLLILPGTHSKWVELDDGVISRFQTVMTGELFALLRGSSLLRASTGEDGGEEGYAAGLMRSGTCTAGIIAALFEARSAQLVESRSSGWALGFLSGLLIGHEVRHLAPTAKRGILPVLVGEPALCALYERAFQALDLTVLRRDGDAAALTGLRTIERFVRGERCN